VKIFVRSCVVVHIVSDVPSQEDVTLLFNHDGLTSNAPQTPISFIMIEPLGELKKDIINGQSIQANRSGQATLAGIVISVRLHPSKYGTEFAGIGFGRFSIKSKIESIIMF